MPLTSPSEMNQYSDGMIEMLKRSVPGKLVSSVGGGMRGATTFSENWSRMAEYIHWQRKLQAKGGMTAQQIDKIAGFHAARASLDYTSAGEVSRNLDQIAPFFNAAIKGWTTLGNAIQRNPWTTLPLMFGTMAVPALLEQLLVALLDDDDELRNKFNQISEKERKWAWFFPVPEWLSEVSGGRPFVKFPKPPGVLSAVARGVGSIFEGATGELSMDQVVRANIEQAKDLALELLTFFPVGADLLVQGMFNHSTFTRDKIVPSSMEGVAPEHQYYQGTPEVFKTLGELTGLSPLHWQAAVFGYTGGLGRIGIQMHDYASKTSKGLYTDFRPSNFPIARQLLVADRGFFTRAMDDYYELRGKVKEVTGTVAKMKKDIKAGRSKPGDIRDYLAEGENKLWFGLDSTFRSVDNTLSTARIARDRIGNTKDTLTARREMDDLVEKVLAGVLRVNTRIAELRNPEP
jgi:hypothetical protein